MGGDGFTDSAAGSGDEGDFVGERLGSEVRVGHRWRLADLDGEHERVFLGEAVRDCCIWYWDTMEGVGWTQKKTHPFVGESWRVFVLGKRFGRYYERRTFRRWWAPNRVPRVRISNEVLVVSGTGLATSTGAESWPRMAPPR